MTVSVEEAWSEVQRELKVRERCFPDWVTQGKLSWADARDRYGRLAAAAALLEKLCETAASAKVETTLEPAQPAAKP
jgi:hypothetical protein